MTENYPLYLLQVALRDEITAHNHALNYFLGNHAYDNKVGSEATSQAFRESQRIAEERIPQLQAAIKAIQPVSESGLLGSKSQRRPEVTWP